MMGKTAILALLTAASVYANRNATANSAAMMVVKERAGAAPRTSSATLTAFAKQSPAKHSVTANHAGMTAAGARAAHVPAMASVSVTSASA